MNNWNQTMEKHVVPRENLMIVDGTNLSFRYKRQGKVDFAADFVRTVNSLGRSYGALKIVVLFDYKGSSYRKDLFPEYKANRKDRYAKQTEEEKLAAEQFFKGLDRAIELCETNFTTIKFKGVEADDVAGWLVMNFEDGDVFEHIWMISTDKDWDELLSPVCSRFSYASRKEYTIDNFYDEHDCDNAAQYTYVKAIMGDMGDNVRGVEGIGAKRAYNLIREYGDIFEIIGSLPLPGKQKYIQALNESGELMLRNMELTDIRSFCYDAINHADETNLEKLEQIKAEFYEELA